MKIFKKGVYGDNVTIQCEDWSKDYPNLTNTYIVGLYPLSKKSKEGVFAPRENKTYRFALECETEKECLDVFTSIVKGEKQPSDYKQRLRNPNHQDCI